MLVLVCVWLLLAGCVLFVVVCYLLFVISYFWFVAFRCLFVVFYVLLMVVCIVLDWCSLLCVVVCRRLVSGEFYCCCLNVSYAV